MQRIKEIFTKEVILELSFKEWIEFQQVKRKACFTGKVNRKNKDFSSVQFSSVAQSSLSIVNSWSLLKLMSIVSVMPSNHLILCHPFLIRVFSNESVLRITWPKYWSFSYSISPSNDIQDWFPLGLTSWISLQSKGLSRVFSNTTVQRHHFFSAQLSL